jgi:hypothetical protein
LFAEFERIVNTAGTEAIVAVDAGSDANNQALVFVDSGPFLRGFLTNGGIEAFVLAGSALGLNAAIKGAGRFQTDNVIAAVFGTLSAADTTATMPAQPTTVRFGSRVSTNQPFGYLRRVAIIPAALTDAQLQAITT